MLTAYVVAGTVVTAIWIVLVNLLYSDVVEDDEPKIYFSVSFWIGLVAFVAVEAIIIHRLV